MKKSNRKGFTIVELVIVIAVIAILAAVLIPTFSNLIKKANISNDTAIAKNMNTILTAEGAIGNINDVYDVIDVLNENGYVLANINTKTQGCFFAWEAETNQILLVDANKDYKVLFAAKEGYGDIDASWYFVVNDAALAASLKTAQPNANVISFLEKPAQEEIKAPVKAVSDKYNKVGSNQVVVADENQYVKLSTNGTTITKLVAGDTVYDAENLEFKVSVGNNSFLTFSGFIMNDDGTVSVPAPIVAFYAEAKYAIVEGALVLTPGFEADNNATLGEFKGAGSAKNVYKNDNGQYVIQVAEGSKNAMFGIAIVGGENGASCFRMSEDGSMGYTTLEIYGGLNAPAYWTYVGAYNAAYTMADNGKAFTRTIRVEGKGYVTFTYVIEVVPAN